MATDRTTVDQFLVALGMVESNNQPFAWGDGGRAMGRWQVHPDRLFSEMESHKIEPKLGETWDALQGRVVRAIAEMYLPDEDATSVAMYWHLGHWSDPKSDDWDLTYQVSFVNALNRVKGQS